MRVAFAQDVLEDSRHWRYLDRILFSVEDGWHRWVIEDPDVIETSAWLQGSNRPSLRKLFEEATVRSTYPQSEYLHREAWLVSLEVSASAIAPPAAAQLFSRPLTVFVENRFADGLFLETIIDFLAPDEVGAGFTVERPHEISAVSGL